MAADFKERNEINEILKEWNPIGVPEPALSDEYSRYIPSIIEKRGDKNILLEFLEDLLVNVIGVDYDPQNNSHKQDILEIISKIQSI